MSALQTGAGPFRSPTPDELQLLSGLRESVFIEDLDGRIIFWNDAAAQLYGWSVADAVGAQAADLISSGLSDDVHDATPIRRRTEKRGEMTVLARRSLLRDERGTIVSWLDASHDLSDRVTLDNEARYAEHRYASMFDSVAVSFWELADTGGQGGPSLDRFCIRKVNARTEPFLNIDHLDQIVGAPVSRFWPTEEAQVFADGMAAMARHEESFTCATWLVGGDGQRIDVLYTLCRLPDQIGGDAFLAGFVDVTDFRRAEQEAREAEAGYRAIFQTLAVALLELDWGAVNARLGELAAAGVTDLEEEAERNPGLVADLLSLGRVVDANETAITVFGGRRREDLLGEITPYWPQASRAVFLAATNLGFKGGTRYEAETRMATMDGREIDVIFTAVAPPDSAETGSIVIGIVDISERVAARAAAERLQAELAHAARVSMLGELTASIAHEVNQPLAAIATNGQASLRWLAREEPEVEEVRGLTDRMVADAYRAADIISRIRAMAAKRGPERSEASLNAIVEEAVLFLRHELQASGVALTMELATDLPTIEADRTQLQQVIVNLAMNAMQAMAAVPSEDRRLAIATRLGEEGLLEVEIMDSGSGIPPDHLGRLFESFFTTKESGLGIGLPICRSIVEAHGGAITVRNNDDGIGATFAFSVATGQAEN